MKQILLSFAVLVAFTGTFAGCGSSRIPTEPVEGVVTLDGVPVEKVNVNFIPKNTGTGETAGGMTDAAGKYVLSSMNGDFGKGALEGEYLVTLSKMEVTTFDKPRPSPSGMIYSSSKELMPKECVTARSTKLTAKVVKGKNTFNFDVKSN